MTKLTVTRRTFLATTTATGAWLAAPAYLRAAGEVNLYSSRHYDTDEALYSDFTKATGLAINRIEANPDELIERMKAEGVNSPADVFISVDAGRIERANADGLLQAVKSDVLESTIAPHLRDPDGRWYGFSKRARVIMYAKDKVDPASLKDYEDLAGEAWKGKVLVRSSTNIYNQSLTGSVLAAHGAEKAEEWCRGLVANFARDPKGGDTDQIKGVAAGEGDVALVNTYYLGKMVGSAKAEDRDMAAKIGVIFPNQGNRGTHVNVSGGGVAATAKNVDGAVKFLEYLVSEPAQRYFADGNSEYPVTSGVAMPETLVSFGEFKEDELNARVYARNNAEALQIMDRAGWK